MATTEPPPNCTGGTYSYKLSIFIKIAQEQVQPRSRLIHPCTSAYDRTPLSRLYGGHIITTYPFFHNIAQERVQILSHLIPSFISVYGRMPYQILLVPSFLILCAQEPAVGGTHLCPTCTHPHLYQSARWLRYEIVRGCSLPLNLIFFAQDRAVRRTHLGLSYIQPTPLLVCIVTAIPISMGTHILPIFCEYCSLKNEQ